MKLTFLCILAASAGWSCSVLGFQISSPSRRSGLTRRIQIKSNNNNNDGFRPNSLVPLLPVHSVTSLHMSEMWEDAEESTQQNSKSSSTKKQKHEQEIKDAAAILEDPSTGEEDAIFQDWTEERKHNLFQFLLRDLQVEGVPLLSVDANQVHTMQAALWTTVAEVYEQYRHNVKEMPHRRGEEESQLPYREKACLIFEDIPVTALRSAVNDMSVVQTKQQSFVKHVPELELVHLSLVGKGVGPAILIEVGPRKGNNKDNNHKSSSNSSSSGSSKKSNNNKEEVVTFESAKVTAAMKMFVDRVVRGMEVCPHMQERNDKESATSTTTTTAIGYRVCKGRNVFHALSAFWNGICEMAASPSLKSIVISMPAVVSKVAKDSNKLDRFASVAELISRTLLLYKGESVYELLHFFPTYTRNEIQPFDKPAHGHLPPTPWFQAMIETTTKDQSSIDELVEAADYQRRSPVMAVCIKRVADMEEEESENDTTATTILELKNGKTVEVPSSVIPVYVNNARRLKAMGTEKLQSDLEREIHFLR